MICESGELIVSVVPGNCRASSERVREYLNLSEPPGIASEDEPLNLAVQMLGGNSPLNIKNLTILIDPKVLENEWILTGGGDSNHLVKIKINNLQKVVNFTEALVRK